ncbi:MAG: DUF1800 domain-containing protein, partial [Chloroherpetonaceae bacterium]|nr:DUF1800 domain-containing protein [Chloroherpetonaceae bacterium]
SGIAPYTGVWNEQTAAHLLRRAMFGATQAQIRQAVEQGLSATLDQLLQARPDPEPPIDITTGETWHDKLFNSDQTADSRYYTYLRAWWIGLMVNQPISLIEKMTLFWHNHFVSDRAANGDARYLYRQNALFRRFALGNFKTLTREVTLDPAMLRYLNGNVNVVGRPNQNYARELFELFTIGKGPELAQGNYTHYTEQDVAAASRVLTGWRDVGYRSTTVPISVVFDIQRHDTGDKQFSAAFQNTVIRGRNSPSAGLDELNDLLDMIFRQAETARFIVRKLYRWFVYYVIDQNVERNVIEPLAQILRQNNYEMRPVLRALFASQHFFDVQNRGAYIKSPADFIVGLHRYLFPTNPTNQTQLIPAMQRYISWFASLQMNLMQHPTVAGWEAYYQEPSYHQLWISSATLPTRNSYADTLVSSSNLNRIALVQSLPNPADPYQMVRDLSRQIFAVELSMSQINYLVENVLMPGVPYYEWTEQWNDFMRNQSDANRRRAVDMRVQNLLRYLFRMAEYQLA